MFGLYSASRCTVVCVAPVLHAIDVCAALIDMCVQRLKLSFFVFGQFNCAARTRAALSRAPRSGLRRRFSATMQMSEPEQKMADAERNCENMGNLVTGFLAMAKSMQKHREGQERDAKKQRLDQPDDHESPAAMPSSSKQETLDDPESQEIPAAIEDPYACDAEEFVPIEELDHVADEQEDAASVAEEMLDEELEDEDDGLGTTSIPVKYMAAPEVKAKVKAEVETEVEANAEAEVETEVEAEATAEVETEVEAKPEAEAEVETKVEAKVEVDVETELAQAEQTVADLENLIQMKEQEVE